MLPGVAAVLAAGQTRNDSLRATKPRREPRVLSFQDLLEFAAAAGSHEAMIRVFSDCGLRLGEVLGLERGDFDGEAFHVRGSAHRGVFTPGDQPTKKHVRTVPVPPSTAELVRAIPIRIDTPLVFPTPSGRLWWERNFYRDVWYPAQEALAGIDLELEPIERRRLVAERGCDYAPHDFRHSWVTHLRAAGIDPADLAAALGEVRRPCEIACFVALTARSAVPCCLPSRCADGMRRYEATRRLGSDGQGRDAGVRPRSRATRASRSRQRVTYDVGGLG